MEDTAASSVSMCVTDGRLVIGAVLASSSAFPSVFSSCGLRTELYRMSKEEVQISSERGSLEVWNETQSAPLLSFPRWTPIGRAAV